jgi:pSer/pThr/pTyr-binding forkhead associated (FHA) protein
VPADGSPIASAVAVAGTTPGKPPICWRCRGFGEPGATICRYCGARYADAGAPAAVMSAAPVAPIAHAEPAPAPRPAAPTVGGAAPARLVSILKDGSDGPTFPLVGEQVDIGRTEGDIVLADDPYLSPRHARLRRKGNAFYLRDLESVNGVYFRIREPVELSDGDRILIGQQVLRFEIVADAEAPLGPASVHGVLVFGTPEVPRMARLVQYTTEGVGRDVHYLYRGETILGRENGDVVFTDDPFLSRRHASIKLERSTRRFVLTDMGSSNGTALRVQGERALAPGDQFRLGRHLFRLDLEGTPMMGRTAR